VRGWSAAAGAAGWARPGGTDGQRGCWARLWGLRSRLLIVQPSRHTCFQSMQEISLSSWSISYLNP
jgi:hypothetical protein